MTEIEALVLSAAIEAPIAGLAVAVAKWPSRGPLHVAAAAALTTAATHPQLWLAVLWAYRHGPAWLAVGLPEAIVVLVEGALIAWIAQMRAGHALAVSLAANGASLLAGLLLQL